MPLMASGKQMTLVLFRQLRDSRLMTLAANFALLVVNVLVLASKAARSLSWSFTLVLRSVSLSELAVTVALIPSTFPSRDHQRYLVCERLAFDFYSLRSFDFTRGSAK